MSDDLRALRPFLNASSAGLQRTPPSRAAGAAAGWRSGTELLEEFFIDLVLRPVVGGLENRCHESLFLVAAKLASDLLARGCGSGGVGSLLLGDLEHDDRTGRSHDGVG